MPLQYFGFSGLIAGYLYSYFAGKTKLQLFQEAIRPLLFDNI